MHICGTSKIPTIQPTLRVGKNIWETQIFLCQLGLARVVERRKVILSTWIQISLVT
jgi:hypothetical protein